MDFEKLKQEAFETAKAHGWHDKDLSDETYLMLIITEISEAVQADRKNKHADAGLFNADVETLDMADGYDRDVWKRDFEIFIKNTVEDDLSDIVIRCLDLAWLRGIDLTEVNELINNGMKDINETFPEVMYYLCSFISSEEQILDDKLNYCMALIIGYCKQKDIDIEFFIEQKMKYNRQREYKHGNKKY